MSFVVDASVVLAWLLPDEHSAQAERILARIATHAAQAPALLHYEVGNALLQAGRRGRIAAALQVEMLDAFFALPVATDTPDDRAIARSAQIARRHGVSLYDACYIELASRRGFPLATLDRALARAARAAGVELLQAD